MIAIQPHERRNVLGKRVGGPGLGGEPGDRGGLSVRTVESHRLRLRRKLGARSSAELARRALEIGLASKALKGTDP
jgi:hypothetical protein